MAKKGPHIEIVHSADDLWWWRLKGANGEIVCTSETFKRKGNAKRAASKAIDLMHSWLLSSIPIDEEAVEVQETRAVLPK